MVIDARGMAITSGSGSSMAAEPSMAKGFGHFLPIAKVPRRRLMNYDYYGCISGVSVSEVWPSRVGSGNIYSTVNTDLLVIACSMSARFISFLRYSPATNISA